MPGMIRLYYWEDIIQSLRYDGPAHRKAIIKRWTDRYGSRSGDCMVHVLPVIPDGAIVLADGSNPRTINRYAKK